MTGTTTGRRMRAAVIAEPRTVRIENVAVPEAGPKQVRVRIEGGGLCGSNLPAWQGRSWMQYPLPPGRPGHEAWGTIDAVGREVRGLEAGQRVAFLSDRSFAEFDVADAGTVLKLPPELAGAPVPLEPLGCAMNVLRRSQIERGHSVAIIGLGFIGAVVTRLAVNVGARVIAIARRETGLQLAKQFGAQVLVPMDDHQKIIGRVKELTEGRFCDRVIECAGEQWPLDLAGELTRERGRLVIAGYHQDPRSVNMQLWNWRGIDVINAHERDQRVAVDGMRLALQAMASGKLDPAPLYTHTFKLEELGRAFEALASRPEGFVKALVVP